MGPEMTATEYELLTQRLITLIANRSPLHTTRLEHDVSLIGRSGPNRIDVLWEFLTSEGTPRRVIIECRKYHTPLKRKDVFAWRGVVGELDTPDMPTLGVMVTLTGYQSGARRVADTWGVVILQVRQPTDEDFAGRLTEIRLLATVRMPHIEQDVHVDAEEELASLPAGKVNALDFTLMLADGSKIPLADYLWAGELRGFDEPPVAPHRITRNFTPAATLLLDGIPRLRITTVSATVGELEFAADSVVLGGRAHVAWMVANVLDHTRLWFTDTHQHYVSDDQHPGAILATDVLLGRPADDYDPTS